MIAGAVRETPASRRGRRNRLPHNCKTGGSSWRAVSTARLRNRLRRILGFVHTKARPLPRRRREYRRGRPRGFRHKEVCAPDIYARRTERYRRFRRLLRTFGPAQARACQFGRRRGHQTEDRVSHRPARHRGRRPGEPLRQRYRGAGCDAAFSFWTISRWANWMPPWPRPWFPA